jgi:hypothetical protein
MLCAPSRPDTHENIDSRRLFRVDPDPRAHRWSRAARMGGARNVIGSAVEQGTGPVSPGLVQLTSE